MDEIITKDQVRSLVKTLQDECMHNYGYNKHSYTILSYGDHARDFRGEALSCKVCEKVLKEWNQTPLGVKITDHRTGKTTLTPYNNG